MFSSLDDLDRGVCASGEGQIGRHADLRYAEWSTLISIVRWTRNLENGDHGVRHVWWVRANPKVDVDERRAVAGEPARLEGDGSSLCRPVCSVGGCGHASAWSVC